MRSVRPKHAFYTDSLQFIGANVSDDLLDLLWPGPVLALRMLPIWRPWLNS
jgi:hypothetical protein